MKVTRGVIYGTSMLAVVAGMINLLSLQAATHVTVSYMTGNITQVIIYLQEGQFSAFLPFFYVISSFFIGAVTSGVIVGSEQFAFGRRYGVALILEGLLILGGLHFFLEGSLWGASLTAMACGLQNAMVATYSGNIIRTTPMTGILADVGSLIGNRLSGRETDRGAISLLLTILGGYIGGVVLGTVLYEIHQFYGLLYPAILLIGTGVSYMVYRIIIRHVKGVVQ